jgi:hypothetical protein
VQRAVPKATQAMAKRGPLKAEVTNLLALVKAIAADPEKYPPTLVAADLTACRRWGQVDDGARALPGVRFTRPAQVAVGRAS